MSTKKDKLEQELKELFYRADWNFKEAIGYLEAAYFCTKDLQNYVDNPTIQSLLDAIEASLIRENREMNRSMKSLKTLLKDALGVEVGVEDYEGESED